MSRTHLSAAAAGALVATVLAGGIAWAAIPDSSGLIHGCYSANGAKAGNGTQLNILDTVNGNRCSNGQTEVTWNQAGPPGPKGDPGPQGTPGTNGTNGTNGQDGVSVTSTALNQGDANCPDGGSKFTAVNGDTYACNGAQGPQGPPGTTSFTKVADTVFTYPFNRVLSPGECVVFGIAPAELEDARPTDHIIVTRERLELDRVFWIGETGGLVGHMALQACNPGTDSANLQGMRLNILILR